MPLLGLVQVTLALVCHLLQRVHKLFDFVPKLVDLQHLLLVSFIGREAVSLEAPLRLRKLKLSSLLLHLELVLRPLLHLS